jgi:hypothetical protein
MVRTLFGWNPRWRDVVGRKEDKDHDGDVSFVAAEHKESDSDGKDDKLNKCIMNPDSKRPWVGKLVGLMTPFKESSGRRLVVDLKADGRGARVHAEKELEEGHEEKREAANTIENLDILEESGEVETIIIV